MRVPSLHQSFCDLACPGQDGRVPCLTLVARKDKAYSVEAPLSAGAPPPPGCRAGAYGRDARAPCDLAHAPVRGRNESTMQGQPSIVAATPASAGGA